MKLILTEPLNLLDYSKPGHGEDRFTPVQPGTYNINEIVNPYGHAASWYMIENTTLGSARRSLHQWDFVTITDDDGNVIPMPPYDEAD